MQAQLWSISGLAIELGMDRRTIAKRLEDLEPDDIKKGKRVEKHWKMSRVFNHLSEIDNPLDELARLNKLRGDRVEHDLSIDKGESASISILTWALSRIAELINSKLAALPLMLKKKTPKLTARDIEGVRRIIVKLQRDISSVDLGTERT